jgi:hypothetical protein
MLALEKKAPNNVKVGILNDPVVHRKRYQLFLPFKNYQELKPQ